MFGRLRNALSQVASAALVVIVLGTAPISPFVSSSARAQTASDDQQQPAQPAADDQQQSAEPAMQAPQLGAREQVTDEVRSVLSQYGSFVNHEKYGEVWVPTVTPQDWHPYPPCHWVNSRRYGWYFDDKTPWSHIVHHYGRWAHDDKMGWIWIPGNEFSPGWVVWRTSPQWIGWAPLPPNEDIVANETDQFNNGGFWIFMETERFNKGCAPSAVAPRGEVSALLRKTQFVTNFTYSNGIAIVVLPPYVVGPLVDINVVFQPWPLAYLQTILLEWNFIWARWDVVVVVNY
ncbi:MAG: DUF6600 domain-containing protein, partial [Methylocystis sp.]